MNRSRETVIKNPNWWRRRSGLERFLTVISIMGCIALLALVILACVVASGKSQTTINDLEEIPEPQSILNDDLCLTKSCVHTASRILNSLDDTVQPCDDFYNFACGNFIKNTVIPEEDGLVNIFSLTRDRLLEQLKKLIVEESKPDEPKPFRLAKDYYKACMNETLIEERGLKPILDITKSIGGWPVLMGDQWNESSWDWVETVKNFRKIGYSVDYIIDFSIAVDLKNSSRRAIDLDQSSLGLNREFLILGMDNKIVKAYYEFMVDVAVIFGADQAQAEKELAESLDFEMMLANISLPIEERRDANALYNPMTIKELQGNYSYIQWFDYIRALLPEKIELDDNEVTIVDVPLFFEELENVLAITPKRAIANYLMWRLHAFSTNLLTKDLRKRLLKYSAAIIGNNEEEPRWKECIDAASDNLPISIGALYVNKHFKEDVKRTALEMVKGIRSEFESILQEVPWIGKSTRISALEKAKSLTNHIGYPDELLDNKKLEEYYEKLTIDPDRYLESALNLNVFDTDYAFNKLREPVNKTDWRSHARPARVNAAYSGIQNSIEFPAGILQGQFFSADSPKYMNYGSIGLVIGHEITHGFDDQGRQFDVDGNLVDWWDPSTKSAFLDKARCIIEQYGNYTEPTSNLMLNGINTQGENIADNGGVKISYHAYRKWVEANGEEPKLPGLDYTPLQMYWISAAQTWCSVYRPESVKLIITTGVHPPNRFRVIGPLSNMKDFAKDFNCPENSKMNPKDKCEVW